MATSLQVYETDAFLLAVSTNVVNWYFDPSRHRAMH